MRPKTARVKLPAWLRHLSLLCQISTYHLKSFSSVPSNLISLPESCAEMGPRFGYRNNRFKSFKFCLNSPVDWFRAKSFESGSGLPIPSLISTTV